MYDIVSFFIGFYSFPDRPPGTQILRVIRITLKRGWNPTIKNIPPIMVKGTQSKKNGIPKIQRQRKHTHILWQEHQLISRGSKYVKLFSRKEIKKAKFTYSLRNIIHYVTP